MQSNSSQLPDYSVENTIEYGRRSSERPARTRRSTTARGATRKSSGYGGVHQRRNKHWLW